MRYRLLAAFLVVVTAVSLLGALVGHLIEGWWASTIGALVAALGMGFIGFRLALGSQASTLDQLSEALRRLEQGDWTVAIRERGTGGLSLLAQRFNALAGVLRAKEQNAQQAERLLRAVIDAAPMAIVLLNDSGTIVYSNQTARELFFESADLHGQNFLHLLCRAPAPFRDAAMSNEDSLFTVESECMPETYHLAKRRCELDDEPHILMMVKNLTRELYRQEVGIWKKLIRVISHELNNSLAPITSLVHSARLIVEPTGQEPQLRRVFDTIEERARHLQDFVGRYATFARLPKPRPEPVPLGEFCDHIKALAPYARFTIPTEGTAYFDRTQMEQVVINLLKNAREAGGEEESIDLGCEEQEGGLRIRVADRGSGMSDEVLQHAVLPFYSTKERGTGLGLALCREIVEAHRGKLKIENRPGGGVLVTCTLPGPDTPPSSSRARITLSRA